MIIIMVVIIIRIECRGDTCAEIYKDQQLLCGKRFLFRMPKVKESTVMNLNILYKLTK